MYSNSQPTDSESSVRSHNHYTKEPTVTGRHRRAFNSLQSYLTDSSWIHLILIIKLISYKIEKKWQFDFSEIHKKFSNSLYIELSTQSKMFGRNYEVRELLSYEIQTRASRHFLLVNPVNLINEIHNSSNNCVREAEAISDSVVRCSDASTSTVNSLFPHVETRFTSLWIDLIYRDILPRRYLLLTWSHRMSLFLRQTNYILDTCNFFCDSRLTLHRQPQYQSNFGKQDLCGVVVEGGGT